MGVLSLLEDAKKKAQANFKANTGMDLNAKNVARNLVKDATGFLTAGQIGSKNTPTYKMADTTLQSSRQIGQTLEDKGYKKIGQAVRDAGALISGASRLTPGEIAGNLGLGDSNSQIKTQGREKILQDVGQSAYGLALTAPLTGATTAGGMLKAQAANAVKGAGLGATIGAIGAKSGERIQGAKEGALSGLKNSYVLPVTGAIGDKLLGSNRFTANFTNNAIAKIGANTSKLAKTGQYMPAAKNALRTIGRNVANQMLTSPLETAAFSLDDKQRLNTDKSYLDRYKERFFNDLAGNAVNGAMMSTVGQAGRFIGGAHSFEKGAKEYLQEVPEANKPQMREFYRTVKTIEAGDLSNSEQTVSDFLQQNHEPGATKINSFPGITAQKNGIPYWESDEGQDQYIASILSRPEYIKNRKLQYTEPPFEEINEIKHIFNNHKHSFEKYLSEEQKTLYNDLLSSIPTDTNGNRLDPITGELWLNPNLYKSNFNKTALYIDKRYLEGINPKEFRKVIRDYLNQYVGEEYQIADMEQKAKFTDNSSGKLATREYWTQSDAEYKNRGETAGKIGKIINNLVNIRVESNIKPRKSTGLTRVIKGDIPIEIDGEIRMPTVVIKEYANGDINIYDITNIDRGPGEIRNLSWASPLPSYAGSTSDKFINVNVVNDDLSIPQIGENVKTQNANIADVATKTPDNPIWQPGNEQNKLFEVESYSPTENEISEAKQYLNKQGIFSQDYYDKSKESFINQLLNPEDERSLVDKQTVDELISHGYLPKNLDPNIDVDEMDKDLIKSLRDMGLLKSTKTDDIYSVVEKAAGKYYDDNTNRRLVETARQLQNEVSAENPQNIVIGNATTTPSNNTIQQTETIANNPQNLDIPEDWTINPEEYKVKNDIGTIDTEEAIDANLKFYQQNRPKTKAEAAKQEASALINPLKFLSERDKQATDNWRSEILTSRVKADQIAREIDDQLGNPDPETAWKITQYMQHPTKEFADQIGLENPEQYDEAIASMRQMYDGLREEVSTVTGRPIGYVENYVPQQWADSDAKVNEVVDQIARSAGNRPNYANERVIPDYQTGISYGLTPKYTHPGQLMAEYYLKSQKAMANNELIQDLLKRDVITTSRYAPAGYKQLTIDTLPTGGKKAYAPAQVATVLNNLFGEGSKGSAALEKTSNVNRVMQNVQLSGGIPKTPLNSFTFGQAIKEITGGNFKVVKSLARSMSNEATENFMQDHQDTIELMAQNGINMGGGDYRDEFVNAMGGADVLQKSMGEKGMDLLDRWFEEPTFKRFIPMKNIEYFETVYDNALQNGATQEEAAQTASDLTKTWMGLVDNYARDKKVSQTINSVFFAPAYREGMLHFWKNVGSTLIDAVKSGDYSDPQTQQMLKFTAGTAITYGLYNVANKLLTGHFMWENKPGKKFSLEIPEDKLPGGEIGRSLFTGILPSSATMPRNAFEIGLAMLNGDGETVKQKVGSYFSPMVKLGFELAANQDYFGNQIRNPNDSVGKQIASTAGYIIGDYSHPYIGGAIDFATNRRNGLETGLKLAETPFYGSRSSDTVDLTKKEYQTYKNVYQSAGKQKANDYATQIKDINQKEKALQKQEEQFSSGEGKIKQQSWWDKLWHKQPEVFTPAETPQLRSKQKAQIKSRLNMLDDTVSSDELNFYYLYDVSKMPENTRYERSKKQNEFYGVYKKILEDEVLNDEQKESLLQNVREGLGRSEAEMSYYLKASAANNDLKTEIVYDDLEGANFANHQDVIDYLVQMRKTLDGKQLATDGVLKNLYEDGVISQSEYKYLKSLTWDENLGDFKSASRSGSSKSSKKSGKSTKNASTSELASRLRSIRISSPTIPRITIGNSNYTPLKVASNLNQVAPIRIGEPVVDPEAILKAAS